VTFLSDNIYHKHLILVTIAAPVLMDRVAGLRQGGAANQPSQEWLRLRNQVLNAYPIHDAPLRLI